MSSLRDRFQQYLVEASKIFRQIEAKGQAGRKGSSPADAKRSDADLEDGIRRLDQLYIAISNYMIEQIGKGQDENEKYRL
jgi:hypothetical protein